ncbi:MAG: MotA/TolQ/ExbB proton channel family protein [Chitinivibrionales bacterium]
MILDILLFYVRSGGVINLLIFAVFFVIVFTGTGRWFLYRSLDRPYLSKERMESLLAGNGGGDWLIETLLEPSGFSGTYIKGKEYYKNRLKEILLTVEPELDKGLDTIAALTSAAPLMGLLGTVIGMIETFQVIMDFGMGNPALLADGISVALVTTQAGLIVSVPSLLFYNILCNKKEYLLRTMVADSEVVIGEKCGERYA